MATITDFLSEDKKSIDQYVSAFVPKTVVIPVNQDNAKNAEITVREGETVAEGQVIALTHNSSVHASIPGTVEAFEQCVVASGKSVKAVRISLSGSFSYLGKKKVGSVWKDFTQEALLKLICDKGVINTFESPKSLSMDISRHTRNRRPLVILRLFDDDPSRITEGFLSESKLDDIAEGAAIIAAASSAGGVIIACDRHDASALGEIFEAHLSALSNDLPYAVVPVDSERYPSGFQRDLALSIKRICKNPPFSQVSTRDIYVDSLTALRTFEAVNYSVPVTDTFVHITGDCLNSSALMKVKIGTPISKLAESCGGFKKQPAQIVVNGRATGFAAKTMDVPVTKDVKSVEFIPASQFTLPYTQKCVRCGQCRQICPLNLYPDILFRGFMHGMGRSDYEESFKITANLCTGCGLCNAVCPSRIPLAQLIPLQKDKNYEN